MQELLEKVKVFIAQFFEKKGNSVVGIDIGSSAIKIVQLRKKQGRAVLETYGELAIGGYGGGTTGQAANLSEAQLAEALTDIIREANVTTTEAGISVPLASSMLTVISIPGVSQERLQEMVPIEARKYIPVPISEVSLDWELIPEMGKRTVDETEAGEQKALEGKHPQRVLIAAIHNDIIQKYQHLASRVELNLSFLEIEVFSFIRSLLGRNRQPALVVDIGAGTTKLSVVENGVPLLTHIINRGSQDITQALSRSLDMPPADAEELKREIGIASDDPSHRKATETMQLIMNGIFSNANRMLLDFEKEYHKTVGKVILSGGGSLLAGVESVAEENFAAPVEYAHPFSKIEAPAFLEGVLAGAGPNFAVATGVALRKLQEIG